MLEFIVIRVFLIAGMLFSAVGVGVLLYYEFERLVFERGGKNE